MRESRGRGASIEPAGLQRIIALDIRDACVFSPANATISASVASFRLIQPTVRLMTHGF